MVRTAGFADGTRIPLIGLGTWGFGGESRPDRSHDDEAVATLAAMIEMGYTHLDTAEMYGGTHTEEVVGQAIQGFDRAKVFITTKVSAEHLRYDALLRACRGSLQRLGTEYVDLYLIHWPSSHIPLEESFRALNKLVGDGMVRRVGVSNFDVAMMKRSVELCATPLATNQVHYNVMHRAPANNGVLAYCQANGILLTAYSPLLDGALSAPAVVEVARDRGATPAQVALRWLIDQPGVITIPKTSNLARARENLGALTLQLPAAERARLDAAA